MTTLISTTITEPLEGTWPQVMSVVQEFDHPVVVTSDFQAVFYAKNDDPLWQGQMSVAPVQFVPTQLSYQIQVSPFANGQLGILRVIGGIQDIYGNSVDLRIGNDFDIYNTTILPIFTNPILVGSGWSGTEENNVLPITAVCPLNTPPKISLQFTSPADPPTQPLPEMWSGGAFFTWVNYALKPVIPGVPFVWEPPYFYAYSGFGFPFSEPIQPPLPPWPNQSDISILYNITSSGSGSQGFYDTCDWILDYDNWQGRVQVWLFGNNVFAEGVVPWTFPAIANPVGDLTPFSIFGFPPDANLQVFKEYPFTYIRP
jgi:hypothetical protein